MLRLPAALPLLLTFAGVAAAGAQDVLRLAEPDPAELRRADVERLRRGEMAHVGVVRELDADPWSHGEWAIRSGGVARWQLEVHSPGAGTIGLVFDAYSLPAGARLAVVGADDRVRSFDASDADDHGSLWTPPVGGDRLRLRLEVAVGRMEQLELHLSGVVHGYGGIGPWGGVSGDCQVDVACQPDREREAEAASVVSLLVGGVRTCTGVLLASTAGDGRALVATADHCGIDAGTAPSVVAWFGYRSPTCGEPPAADPGAATTGARLLARVPALDLVLVELDDPPPPAARWAGWDRLERGPAELPLAALHHPGSDRLKVALAAGDPEPAAWLDAGSATGGHLRVRWSTGTTEGGSSGAPLFDARGRVVGLLRGGWASCSSRSRPDWFARLGAAWDGPSPRRRLRDWLDPADTGVLALDGHGDPRGSE